MQILRQRTRKKQKEINSPSKIMFKIQKKRPFSICVQIQKENITPHTGNTGVYSIRTPAKSRETVNLNGITFSMQVDMGSDVTLIPKNFWQKVGKPKLRKSNRNLKQFDGSIIKTLESIEGHFDIKTF